MIKDVFRTILVCREVLFADVWMYTFSAKCAKFCSFNMKFSHLNVSTGDENCAVEFNVKHGCLIFNFTSDMKLSGVRHSGQLYLALNMRVCAKLHAA